MNKCHCGKKMSQYANRCNSCHKEWMAMTLQKAREIVSTGACPECGGKLKRNLSMSGWWQCEQLGSEQFRKDPTKPSCAFQTFTE